MPDHTFPTWLRRLALGICWLAALVSLHGAQTTDDTAKKNRPYRIANTDKLRISIFQEDDLSTIARVDTNGAVNLKLVQSVRVAGLTISEAERTIEAAYRDNRYLRSPQVTVNVEEYAPREVTIMGQVRAPARYPLPIESPMTVLDLVTKAGGFTDVAKGTEVKITRVGPDGKSQTIEVDVESLIKGRSRAKPGDSSIELEDGDIVYVPERII
jgi:polysaccharide export outer membrane protein